jgi:hypothetical protein
MALHKVRRIVTGHDAEGRAVVIEDAAATNVVSSPARPDAGLTNLWLTGAMPADCDATDPMIGAPHGLLPPKTGTIFRFFQIPPGDKRGEAPSEETREATRAAFAAMGAGAQHDDTARHAAMHKTETVDYIMLLKGEVTLILDADERDMQPLDVVIQRGTNHAWANYGTEPAVLMAVLVDGTF